MIEEARSGKHLTGLHFVFKLAGLTLGFDV
jgi:hypothetical protein